MPNHPKKEFMDAAIKEAEKSRNGKDYSIGAIIVKENKIIARGGNRVKIDHDPTSHAEIIAIREASKTISNRHLNGCVLYTTHEPCPMCAAAAVWAKLDGIVFGARMEDMVDYKLKNGNDNWSWRTITVSASLILKKGDPKLFLVEEFMREECKKLFHN